MKTRVLMTAMVMKRMVTMMRTAMAMTVQLPQPLQLRPLARAAAPLQHRHLQHRRQLQLHQRALGHTACRRLCLSSSQGKPSQG